MRCFVSRWFVVWIALLLCGLLIQPSLADELQSKAETSENNHANDSADSGLALPHYSNEALLTQMLVTDFAERTLDTTPALAITFSQDIDPKKNFNDFISLTEAGKVAEGAWVLAEDSRRLYFPNIKPQTDYQVSIRPGLTAKNGLRSLKPFSLKLKTQDVKPAFDFATQGSVLPAKLTSGLPIRVVNVPEVDIEFLRVKPEKLAEMLRRITIGERVQHLDLEAIHDVTESVHSSRYVTGAKPNARTTAVIPVESIAELKEPGLYFAVMRQPGRFSDDAIRINQFVVTNIGLHVRLYPRGLEVFANRLDNGKPLKNIQLQLQAEKETLETRTDELGHASFVYRPVGNLLLTAMDGKQFAFLDLREAALDLSEYAVTGAKDQAIAPFVYSTRDLFRPGEAMDLSVLLRNRDGEALSVNKLHLRIVRPDGKPLLEETLTAADSDLGYFTYRLAIPSDAATGKWVAEIRSNAKDENAIGEFVFHVEDFMPERMQLTLNSAVQQLQMGEKWIVGAQGDYLYGAPAAGNRLTVTRNLTFKQHPLTTWQDYFFGNPTEKKINGDEVLPEVTLDDKGAALLEMPALTGKIDSPLRVSLIGHLQETGGRTVTRTTSVLYWPAPSLVGIRPAFTKDTVDNNSTAHFDLVRVNSQGNAVPSQKALAVTLVRESKTYFWEYNDAQGWKRKAISNETPVSLQKITLDTQAKAGVDFPVTDGYYRLEVEDSETGLKAVYPFHAGWDWEQADKHAQRPDQIELALDQPSYFGGEMAKLTITPPAAGDAIIAVEGESMLWSKRITLPSGASTVEIPIDKAWNRHDLYITVTAFRPANAQQNITPNRALGVIFLPLNRESRHLDVQITAPEKSLPEQTVTVTVSSAQLKGENAMVTLTAVDEGILNITGFKTPDPFAFYFARHSYDVNLYDAYGKIIENVDAPALQQRFGGDGGLAERGGALPPSNMRIVNLFSGPVKFQADGKAEIELDLPGFDGSLRLMAIAATRGKLGSAEKSMVVSSPVVASMSAPRFLAAGDQSFLTIDLNNTTAIPQNVNFNVSANPVLDLAPVNNAILLEKGQHKTIRLPLAARQVFGVADINLVLTGQGFTAHRQLSLQVRPAYPAKHLALNKMLQPGETFTLDAGLLKGFLANASNTYLTISPTPALPLRNLLDNLFQYPYGCLEQTTSKAWPYLYLESKIVEQFALPPLSLQQREQHVQAALTRISGMQLPNGSFALWDDASDEEYWLTPYVTDFLLDAKEQGFTVPEWLLERALNNLTERVQEQERYIDSRYGNVDEPEHVDFAARAYAVYVLSRVKRVTLATLRSLYEQDANKAVSGLSLVHLGLALRSLGDSAQQGTAPRWQLALDKALSLKRDEQLYLGDYGSPLRDDAAMLYLLLKYKITLPQYEQRIEHLAEMLHNKADLSTQEQLFTFLAGLQVQKKSQESWQANLQVDGKTEMLSQSQVLHRLLSAASLGRGVQIQSKHTAPLYLAVNLAGYSEQAPALDNDPVSIQRDWYDMKGHKVTLQEAKAGTLLLAHLTVNSNVHINDAMVVDLLPAGLEIENTHLQDVDSIDTLQLDDMEKPLAELVSNSNVRYEQFLDDRYLATLPLEVKTRNHLFYLVRVVSSGSFTIPPPLVEDMYRPELNGVGVSAGMLTIP